MRFQLQPRYRAYYEVVGDTFRSCTRCFPKSNQLLEPRRTADLSPRGVDGWARGARTRECRVGTRADAGFSCTRIGVETILFSTRHACVRHSDLPSHVSCIRMRCPCPIARHCVNSSNVNGDFFNASTCGARSNEAVLSASRRSCSRFTKFDPP